MLDPAISEQLKGHFAALEADYVFLVSPSHHESQPELLALLESLAETSPHLHVVVEGVEVPAVRFELHKNAVATGVRFAGIPGGHEFTSLVLAILNADGKGRLPDEGIVRRIRALRGPVELRTYISLSCTNCPDVVQALNLMTLLHGDMRHVMIDGGLVPDEISRLGIQGVPTVYAGDKLLHVGRSSLAELLERLEEHFGHEEPGVADGALASPPKEYDMVVIGGGPAGCSAAIYSARKGLSTALVATRIGGQVTETLGIENLVSVTRTEGPRLAADLDRHVRSYPVEMLEHRKVERIEDGERKLVHLTGGETLSAQALILCMGAKWRELGIPGEKEYLGRGVAFCPHCDGPFYKGRRVAVIGGGNSGVEAALDLAGICAHVTVFEFLDALKADAVLVRNLHALQNATVITNARTLAILGSEQNVTALRYQDRATEEEHDYPIDGVFVQIGLVPNSSLVKDLVDVNRFGEIVVDSHGRTSATHIYAAGDVTTVPYKQIVIAMGEGAKAALSAFEDRIRSA
jgi:NADH-dependent peroxiredoxin subunit F